MKKITLIITFLLISSINYAQNTTDDLTNTFITKYEKNTDEAFDYIFGTNRWIANDSEGTKQVKNKIKQYAQLMGEYIGFEKISEKSLGKSLKVAVYVVKYDRQPLRFIFKYYKARENWMLYNLKFDDSIDDDLEKIMKYDYLSGEQ